MPSPPPSHPHEPHQPHRYDAESKRLWLQPLSAEEHLEDFHQLWVDEEAVKWTTRITRKTVEETAEWLVTILPSEDMPDIDKWAILLRNDGDDDDIVDEHSVGKKSVSDKSDSQLKSAVFRGSGAEAGGNGLTSPTNEAESERQGNSGGGETKKNLNRQEVHIDENGSPTAEVALKSQQVISNQKQRKKPKCIGIVGTNRWSDQGMETGYALNKDYWGKGYATEAFALFLDMYWRIDERKNIPHLVAKVYPDNLQSFKVLRKCNGREGEILKSVELRGGAGEKGDLHCWYFDRPVEERAKGSEGVYGA